MASSPGTIVFNGIYTVLLIVMMRNIYENYKVDRNSTIWLRNFKLKLFLPIFEDILILNFISDLDYEILIRNLTRLTQ